MLPGLYVCNGTKDNQCPMFNPVQYITATLTVFTRQATIVAATSNMSIIGVSDLTPPAPRSSFDLPTYRMVLEWLFNFTATNTPAPSAIAEHFWANGENLVLSPLAATDLRWNFQSILAFPFWLFNANNFANPELVKYPPSFDAVLPAQFHTNAIMVAAFDRIYFDDDTTILFCVTQGFVVLFVWVVLLWAWLSGAQRRVPATSSFTMFDSAFKAQTAGRFSGQEIFCTNDQDILDIATSTRVVLYESNDIHEVAGQEGLAEVHEVYGTHKRLTAVTETNVHEMQA